MKIVIPSYKRGNDVRALKKVSPVVQQKYYWLAVREEEAAEYAHNYPNCNIKILPNVSDVCNTRQRVNEVFDGVILVIDDDVRFRTAWLDTVERPKQSTRREIKEFGGIRQGPEMTDEDYDIMCNMIEEKAQTNHFGGVKHLSFPVSGEGFPWIPGKPAIWAVWYNLDKIDTQKYSYEHGPLFMEDIFMVSYLFNNFFEIEQLTSFCVVKGSHTGGQQGGCQTSTRYLHHNKSAVWLAHHFPNNCKLHHSNLNSRTMGGENCFTLNTHVGPNKRGLRKECNSDSFIPYVDFDPYQSPAYHDYVRRKGKDYLMQGVGEKVSVHLKEETKTLETFFG